MVLLTSKTSKKDSENAFIYSCVFASLFVWNFSTVFVYATGNTLTLPESAFLIDGDLILEWGERNSHRMEPYHRLDIALTLDGKKKGNYQSSWSFSIYNVYNRENISHKRYNPYTSGRILSDVIMLGTTPTIFIEVKI